VTYSIVAVDTTTGELGGAGTSCLDGGDVFVIYRGVPDRGVVHAQAYYDAGVRDRAALLLSEGQSAANVLATITQPSFDADAAIRQYGLVDVSGSAVGFTGTGTTAFAADRQGHVAGFAYSVQGNILTSQSVLDQASAAFEAGGCDLAERLLRGLLAGAENGEGDSRCTVHGLPSDSAFLQVERPRGNEGDYLSLRIASSGEQSPLPLLEQRLTAWRAAHPCPTPVASSPPQADSEEGGCACRLHAPGANNAWLAWLLLGLLLFRRRRTAPRELRPGLLPR
jgi:MYXO-CTERM domain-containing protein